MVTTTVHTLETAPDASKPLLENSIKAFGRLPSLHGVMATSPGLLEGYQHLHRLAIHGTAPVAYFTEGKPVAGNDTVTHDYMGVTWRFSSEENRDLFAADPVAYAPQYGGYCAYAVSQGYTASTVPEAWSIVDDKLYLNFSTSVRRRWERDIPAHIMAAAANWPSVLS